MRRRCPGSHRRVGFSEEVRLVGWLRTFRVAWCAECQRSTPTVLVAKGGEQWREFRLHYRHKEV